MKNPNPTAVRRIFILFLAVAFIIPIWYIISSPNDVAKLAPDNTSGNILAGGAFAEGDSIEFYVADDTLYSIFNDSKTLIKSEVGTPIYSTDGAVAYAKDGNLYQIQANGSGERLLLENANNPLIIGRWVYYTDGTGQLCKYRIDDGKASQLGLYVSGNYYVSATRIYYLGTDGFLYTALTDGSDNSLVCSYKMTDFIIGGSYIVYRNEGGVLCWFPEATPDAKAEHIAVSAYNYVSSYIIYRENNSVYSINLKTMETLCVAEDAGADSGVYCDSDNIYYFNTDAVLTRVSPDNSSKTTF